MHPILLILGGYEARAYTLCTALALLIVFVGTYVSARKKGFAQKPLLYSLAIMSIAAFLGARLLHLATNFSLYQNQPWRLYAFDLIGFSVYGGILAAVIAAFICARIFKLNIWRLGDITAPWLGLGIATMRVGCFLNGCCFGKETNLPWGITFPFMSYAHRYQLSNDITHLFFVSPVHPTQLFELSYALLGSVIAVVILRKKMNDGVAIIAFGIWYSIFRLINYYLRVPPSTFEASPFFYPALYGAMIVMLAVLLKKRCKKNSKD